jgi:hypothetical protein
MKKICLLLLAITLAGAGQAAGRNSTLERGFAQPPAGARPWVYWFWLNSNITSNGITADLEAMQRVGIGGVLIMEVDQGTPKGLAAFAGPQWRALFQHVVAEANRLGLEVNMNNDAGWCGSGGPWITPELAMQKVVWTTTKLQGPRHFAEKLPQPDMVAKYYRDIAVLAFPTPAEYRIDRIQAKAAFTREEVSPRKATEPLPPEKTIPRDRILELTAKMSKDGQLVWDVPPGNWSVLRFGHTPTGKDNHPAPESGRGLECDKLSRKAVDVMFEGLMGKLVADSKPLAGKSLVATHIDSWEVGSQNWTPGFREEFRRLRGYDPLPFLPVMTGQVVDGLEVSERFLWDLRQTISELLICNYAGYFQELAHKHRLRLSIEAYDAPCDDMTYAGRADEPMGEFWSWTFGSGADWCTEMASAAHIYGKRIVGAEAFTATDKEKWLGHPGGIKALGDWAFCEGINRFVFHRYALQPWRDVKPGMSMGPWGLHYERTQTWWEQSKAWHEYLARCQFLLQQGLFVADICYLEPEASPNRFRAPPYPGNPSHRPPYNFDGCTPEVVLTRMKVKDGRLVLPDGMSYRVMVLPKVMTMTPRLLSKIKELVADGATIIGAPPVQAPGLTDYPRCDEQVKELAKELWGGGQPLGDATGRSYGKGRVLRLSDEEPPKAAPEAKPRLGPAKWIWFKEGNPAVAAPVGTRYFRRLVNLESGAGIESARMVMTADNEFGLWVNGRQAGTGDDFTHTYAMDCTRLLKAGTNLLAVAAVNGADAPNPAGLIGSLFVKYHDGRTVAVHTDGKWEAATTVADKWAADAQVAGGWEPAMELGPPGMAPWGEIDHPPGASPSLYPAADVVAGLMKKMGVPPDFEYWTKSSEQSLRYIHKRIGKTELFFVANEKPRSETAICSFRVPGKRPELWWPDSGRIEALGVYDEVGGCIRAPIAFEPSGSVFVIFRPGEKIERERIIAVTRNGEPLLDLNTKEFGATPDAEPGIELVRGEKGSVEAQVWQPGTYGLKAGSGRSRQFQVTAIPGPVEITGPWDLRFPAGCGAPDHLRLERLISWSQLDEPGAKYFSGAATYSKSFVAPSELHGKGQRLYLDLGNVAVMAQVKLNGKELGTLWKAPYRVEITEAIKAGENRLEVKVVNLWINRMIGDEQLPEDSERNPNGTLKQWPQWLEEGKPSPAGRYTFTSWRLWKKDSPLQESGLLGPVRIIAAKEISIGKP